MGELDGRVAIITGSSRGIGAAIARRFAAEGAVVVVHGRDIEAVASVKAQIEGEGGSAFAVIADVADSEQVQNMLHSVNDGVGPVDVLVANAGGSPIPPCPLDEITDDGWRVSIDANLTGTFLTIKAFLPDMKRQRRGAIVTVSSAAAHRPTARSPIAYAAAKAGIELLTKSIALEAGPHGIRVNCIAPETILTERNLQQIPEPIQQQLIDSHPIKRLGQPDDIADAAVFLVSDRAGWISGITLDVAGGSVLT